jgi:hypothetical protein
MVPRPQVIAAVIRPAGSYPRACCIAAGRIRKRGQAPRRLGASPLFRIGSQRCNAHKRRNRSFQPSASVLTGLFRCGSRSPWADSLLYSRACVRQSARGRGARHERLYPGRGLAVYRAWVAVSALLGTGLGGAVAQEALPPPVRMPAAEVVVEPGAVSPADGAGVAPAPGPAGVLPPPPAPSAWVTPDHLDYPYAPPLGPLPPAPPRRLYGLLPPRCWTTHNNPGCGSCWAELVYVFGSCRAWYGEPCFPGPQRSADGTGAGAGRGCACGQ